MKLLLALALVVSAGCDSCTKTDTQSCCKTCTNSQACGDSCIPLGETCHKAPGCACAK